MIKLQDLRNTFIKAIVQYYISKTKSDTPLVEGELLSTLLQKPFPGIISQLNEYIITATPVQTRRSLLLYLLSNAQLIDNFIKSDQLDLDNESITLVQKQLVHFIIDMQCLLQTSQSTEIAVHYEQDPKMYGCVRRAWTGGALCDSGRIISDTLLSALRITKDTSLHEIEEIVADIILFHRQEFLLASMTEQCRKLSLENERLREEQASLKAPSQSLDAASATPLQPLRAESAARSRPQGAIISRWPINPLAPSSVGRGLGLFAFIEDTLNKLASPDAATPSNSL